MTLRYSSLAAVALGLIAVSAPVADARAASLDWQVCLKTRAGTFIDAKIKGSNIPANLEKCAGNAIFTIRDLGGGLLMGEDKVYIGSAGLKTRWATDRASGGISHSYVGYKGGTENFHLHRADRKKIAIGSEDQVALNAYTGKWVSDQGGEGPLKASSDAIGAGETFTIVFPAAEDVTAGATAALEKSKTALKARPPKAPDAEFSKDDEIHYGDKIMLSAGDRYLTADITGQVFAKKVKATEATVFEIYDPKGGTQKKRQVNLRDSVALRVAGTQRWLSASDKQDDGLIYKMVPLNSDVYNFNTAEADSNGGLNNVVVMRPETPKGWVWIGDSVFRYREDLAKDVYPDKMYSIIFKDNPKVFKKPQDWILIWASGKGSPRDAIAVASPLTSPFNTQVGATFYTPWCCKGLENARLIHKDYVLSKPPTGDDFFATATGQWTQRYQKFANSGMVLIYNAAAFTYLADGKPLPLMRGAKWGLRLGCGAECGWGKGVSDVHPAGNADFLNKKFLDDFSYHALPRQLRARPGASGGNKPANETFSSIRFNHIDSKKYKDTSPILSGMRVVINRDLYSKIRNNGRVWFEDKCYSCSVGWRITKLTRTTTREVDIEPNVPGRGFQLAATGPGAVPASLAPGWEPYVGQEGQFANPRVTQEGDLFVLSGMITGNNKFGRVLQLPRIARPSESLIFNANNHAKSARVDIGADGRVTWVAGGGTYGGWLSLSGITFSTKKGKALSLANGWRPYGKGLAPPTVFKTGNLVTLGGVITGGQYGHLATLPGGYRPPGRLIFSVNHQDEQSRIDVLPNGQVVWMAGGRKYGWVSLSGITFNVSAGQNLPLVGTWKPFGQGYRQPEVSKQGNIVSLSGMLKGTKKRPAHLSTLPVGYRPPKQLIFNVNAHDKPARITISPNGTVRLRVGATEYGWVSLSGINFAVAPKFLPPKIRHLKVRHR